MPGFQLKQPQHRELSGGDLLAQCLKQLGVDTAFGIHGGHLDAFLMGCDHSGIRLVDTRHETVAVQAAEGYAKVKGKVGVCFVTANSGFSNSLPGLATAIADRSPIFVITSSPPLRDAETNCLQGFLDQVVVSKPLTKFSHRVTHPEEIPRLVSHAYRTANSGTPGPVMIDFPIEILFSPVRQESISWGSISSPQAYPPSPSPRAVTEALALWKAAKRPAIVISTGCRGAEASKSLLELAEATQTPIFQSMKGFGPLLLDHPLHAGLAGNLAKLPYVGKPRPDLIFMLGARTGMFMGGRSGIIIPERECKLIQIDIDGSEIGRSCHVDVGIVSDMTEALQSFNAAVKSDPFQTPEEWVELATSLKHTPSASDKDQKLINSKMHPYHALKAVLSALEPGCILSIDGGEAGSWTTDLLEVAQPSSSFFSAGYLGMLGNGFGYSLGAAVADPTRQIINIQGDGSAGFHFSELDTYARHKLNILTVVVNNYVWGMSIHGQELVYGDKNPARPVSTLSATTRYDVIAGGFGNESAMIDKLEDIEATVKRFSEVKGPACINLIVSDKPTHSGTVAMVSPTDDPNMIVVPYYDNIPRPYYK
ncbi:acetolactate synthase I/II/III large subunit [Mollisia scopiformis]|uniref:Acetolactate synthase I/II/III large subunit n=1 Tax=Mollisia scopiformis TaxID=149040 RepID=A0A194X0E4_MOLSC|nr:acetolactate synthase I/II/III large subunit [Mollisia scopiformis]KUJ13665.1 acetolactate synthase I/II/III large subunit [Mollisia scopiformis]